jgi:hypothetical protein
MTPVPILLATFIQYQALAAPVLVPVPASQEGGGPGIRTGTVPTVQYLAHTSPIVIPSQVVSPVTGASPLFPAKLYPKRGTHPSRQQAFAIDVQWEAPGAVTAPDVAIVSDTQPRRRAYRTACYVIPPEFGVPTEVPVMAWTAHIPTRLPQWSTARHPRFMQGLAWDHVLVPAVVTAPDVAQPTFPDRLPRARRVPSYPQASWNPFTADATVVVPHLSWQGEFPDRIWPERGLAARHTLAFTFNPLPVPVIAVTAVTGGRGYYTVPPRTRTFIAPPRTRKFVV